MTIDQIESFVAVASSGSISQAAARLFRSQPNLSYSLKQLEAELGYPLLVRTNQGVTLTSGGREFLSYAQDALRAFHQLRNFSIVRTAENESTLRVAAMPFCGVSEAVEMLLAELDQPPTQILLNPCMRDGMIAGLNSRQYDVGYAYAYSGAVQSFMTQLDVNGLEAQPLCKCRPCALIGPGSPWFSSPPEKLSVQQLNSVRRVFFTKSGAQSFSSTQFCPTHLFSTHGRRGHRSRRRPAGHPHDPFRHPLLQSGPLQRGPAGTGRHRDGGAEMRSH